MVMSLVWQVFEPLLFGLVGAEVSVEYMNSKVVGVLRFPLFLFFLCFFCCSYCSLLLGEGGGWGGGLRWQAFNLEIKHEQCYCYKNNCITTCTCTVSLNYLFAGSHDCYATLYYRRSADKLIIGEFMCKSTS